MEFPDAAVLGARHGFEGLAIRDLSSRAAGVIYGVADYERGEATLGQPELALNGKAVLGWGEGKVLLPRDAPFLRM